MNIRVRPRCGFVGLILVISFLFISCGGDGDGGEAEIYTNLSGAWASLCKPMDDAFGREKFVFYESTDEMAYVIEAYQTDDCSDDGTTKIIIKGLYQTGNEVDCASGIHGKCTELDISLSTGQDYYFIYSIDADQNPYQLYLSEQSDDPESRSEDVQIERPYNKVILLHYLDSDGDGYGDPNTSVSEESWPAGYVLDNTDCDDTDASVYPGALEFCDGIDNQCPGDLGYGSVDEGCPQRMIPAGCFEMGDAFNEGSAHELPVHNVCISSFYMDVHEVTNAEYAACVSTGGCTAPYHSYSSTRGSYYGEPTYDDFPVIYVSWNQADDYCAWAGKRLPTEAEWEYAARGGLSGKRYPLGDAISGTDANYADSGDPWDNDTSQVEYYAANGYGLYDMAGNVYEWVNDWYQSDYYSTSPTNDPAGPASGTERVLRGGGWGNITVDLRVAMRGDNTPTNQYNIAGFRCAGD
jgi:hypothetical protein